jgi:hypothetical protein
MYPEDQPSEFALHQSRAAVGPSASTGASLLWRRESARHSLTGVEFGTDPESFPPVAVGGVPGW